MNHRLAVVASSQVITGSKSLRQFLANRGIPLLATTAFSALGVVLVTWPLGREMGSASLRSGEVLLTAWQLNWYQHALVTDPLAWVDANIFFPYQNAATFNDLLLTHAVVTLPAAWAESPVLALNLAMLGGIVACGLFAHLLIVELVDAPWAATIGGTLFALTPFRLLHLGHLSIAAAWSLPFFFWALLRHLREPSWGRGALAAVSGVALGASSLYHAAYVAPVVPLVLLVGARRGPGGRRVWLPLLLAGLPCLVLLAVLIAPFATTLRSYGVAAAPHDLFRYGADLSSLGQRPDFLGGTGGEEGINPEAHLYPGGALTLLASAGAITAAAFLLTLRGWRRRAALAVVGLGGAVALGVLLPLEGPLKAAWELGVLALIWGGPVATMVWAIARADSNDATGLDGALRLGVAGAALSFVLALGPQARYLTEAIGPAPYGLLVQASSAFEGTRVPARFGGIVMLFLALLAAGALAALARGSARGRRLAAVGVAALALVACFSELPVPALPQGRELVPLPDLQDRAYRVIRDRPGRFGILELPDWPPGGGEDYEYREFRALRYMLASKQHGRHLVNGTGRIEPFLWHRFRDYEAWSDGFFGFITAYFPVDYVLVHEEGIPDRLRDAVLARLDRGTDGWREAFRSPRVRAYTIDRSFGRGTYVDRFVLRRAITPRAEVVFSARVAPDAASKAHGGSEASTTLELLRDGEPIEAWALAAGWREFRVTFPVAAVGPDSRDWPRAGTLLRWRVPADTGAAFEIRSLSVEPSPEPLH